MCYFHICLLQRSIAIQERVAILNIGDIDIFSTLVNVSNFQAFNILTHRVYHAQTMHTPCTNRAQSMRKPCTNHSAIL